MTTTNEYDGPGVGKTQLVRAAEQVEGARALDLPVRLLQPFADALNADQGRSDALRGIWLGHALHPIMTDLPIGFWTSANVLDLVGGKQSRAAATRLLTLGLLSALPTAVTGLAEWGETGQREKRVGVAHAAANSVALVCYTSSLLARRKNRHGRGVLLALAGSAATGVGGFLGGHLAMARKVSSRHPAFSEPSST